MLAPARTPKEIVQRLHDEVAKVLNDPSMKQNIKALGAYPMPLTPPEFEAYLTAELNPTPRSSRPPASRRIRKPVRNDTMRIVHEDSHEILGHLALAAAVLLVSAAHAQEWPTSACSMSSHWADIHGHPELTVRS